MIKDNDDLPPASFSSHTHLTHTHTHTHTHTGKRAHRKFSSSRREREEVGLLQEVGPHENRAPIFQLGTPHARGASWIKVIPTLVVKSLRSKKKFTRTTSLHEICMLRRRRIEAEVKTVAGGEGEGGGNDTCWQLVGHVCVCVCVGSEDLGFKLYDQHDGNKSYYTSVAKERT